MKKVIVLILVLFPSTFITAQNSNVRDSSKINTINQQIDNYVVKKNTTALDTLYAEDFVFSHGSGRVEGKDSWIKTVDRNNYPLRKHDSVTVEMHPGIAIVRGRMAIQRIDKDKTVRYTLKYVRVYAFRKQAWQLISHITTHEYHED